MANFYFILPAGSKLYKGEQQETVITDERHTWFAEHLTVAQKYGKVVTTYTTTKDLKLINISSPLFHFDYIGKVNLLFRHKDIDDMNKALSLMPLGLPTTNEARRTLSRIPLTKEQLNINDRDDIIDRVSYLYNAHRMSISVNNVRLDDYLVNTIREIYADYDGYIQPLSTPTALFGGQYNHPEICIFKPGSALKKPSKGGKKQKGGAKFTDNPPNVINIPGFTIEKMLERDRRIQGQKPKMTMLPYVNMMQ